VWRRSMKSWNRQWKYYKWYQRRLEKCNEVFNLIRSLDLMKNDSLKAKIWKEKCQWQSISVMIYSINDNDSYCLNDISMWKSNENINNNENIKLIETYY